MFFGQSRQRKSYTEGTPEYNEWVDEDNTSDLEELYNRMKKAGFEGGPGVNKDRWTYGDSVFDFENLGGNARKISNAKLDELISLLDRLDREDETDDDGYEEMAKNYPLIFGDNKLHGPTGIVNPSDYMSIVQEDTDNDGDIDKVSIEEKNEED